MREMSAKTAGFHVEGDQGVLSITPKNGQRIVIRISVGQGLYIAPRIAEFVANGLAEKT